MCSANLVFKYAEMALVKFTALKYQRVFVLLIDKRTTVEETLILHETNSQICETITLPGLKKCALKPCNNYTF